MNILGGLIGGAIAGVIGAAVWAGISYGTGYEIGWIAWGIGAVVGFGVAAGCKGGGAIPGILAVVLAVVSILGGRYAAIQLMISKELGDDSQIIESEVSALDDPVLLISYIADEVAYEFVEAGKEVKWPPGVDPGTATEQWEYPQDVWAEAQRRWQAMSEEDREAFRAAIEQDIRQNMPASMTQIRGQIAKEGFVQSFDWMDILFFGLAIVTAFKIAGSGKIGEADV